MLNMACTLLRLTPEEAWCVASPSTPRTALGLGTDRGQLAAGFSAPIWWCGTSGPPATSWPTGLATTPAAAWCGGIETCLKDLP
jgi:imidazolonepropionase-like amidohydrolase